MAIAIHKFSPEQISRLCDIAGPLYVADYRTYHNWYHIMDVLHRATDILESANNHEHLSAVQTAAILFHDAIYIPGCKENEFLSGMLMRRLMEREENRDLFTDEQDLDHVYKIILATREHFSDTQFSPEINIVLDADLCSLAKTDYVDFLNTQHLILREFSHVSLEKRTFGQKAILSSLLNRSTIYRSDPERYPILSVWESCARSNLERYCSK